MEHREKVIKMIKDNIEHKKIVMDNSLLIAEYLIENRRLQLAIDVLRRACSHDNSKFELSEFYRLVGIMSDNTDESFTNPLSKMTDREVNAVEVHWRNNRHHPEHHDNINDMSESDIIEMVCDWFSRSQQYGTDFMEFVECRQKNRFKFSDDKYRLVEHYCILLQNLYNNKVNDK